jgi:hypothetical protein
MLTVFHYRLNGRNKIQQMIPSSILIISNDQVCHNNDFLHRRDNNQRLDETDLGPIDFAWCRECARLREYDAFRLVRFFDLGTILFVCR